MNETVKGILIATAAFSVLIIANMSAEALYTNSKIGVDKKTLLFSMLAGIAGTYIILKTIKK